MFKKLFGQKSTSDKVVSPMSGQVVGLEEVPDPTFSEKMMGDGVAIKPDSGEVVSPVDGEILQLFPTKHAIGIQSVSGIEYLIHIGLETVALEGEGFEAHVKQGDKVSAGDLLITVDLDIVAQKANSTITPIVITNEVSSLDKKLGQTASKGETEIMYVEK
ncbi:PTS sugar transporter subunit IIA [Aureibacillus halotolerans]|uniref:PTS system IIA component (Glc family) n=1 Tax=Aureibacillus halotolerans TaxID=1508390 RepID=A0A4R6TYI0_9BACI|nr:PTS glucose transporter subunit IIA [Aureibacillus halotolerans]TDQ37453.1 PTS system IIA component (Glc family) [Aureibacillus halotolerans]